MSIESIIPASADDAASAAFGSVDAALRFAFDSHAGQEAGTLARFQKQATSGRQLFDGKLDRAAWAGDIRRRIHGMHHDRAAILVLRFAPRRYPCACRRPCCSGHRWNWEWLGALRELTMSSTYELSGQMTSRKLREGIIRKWAGAEKINIGDLADECGVHRNTAGQYAKVIRKWLDRLYNDAVTEADGLLLDRAEPAANNALEQEQVTE